MNALITSIQTYVSIIRNKLDTLPNEGVLMIDDPAVPSSLMAGAPIANLAIAEDDSDVTTLEAMTSLSRFLDMRDNTLHEQNEGVWTTRPYDGDEAFLRPKTLCFSVWNGRFYYTGNPLALTRVNTGTSPTL